AQMITTRVTSMSWGAIFKIEFVDLKSRAKQRREIPTQYFIVTDDRIVLLNEENNDAAARKISAMEKPPAFEEGDVRGITSGKLKHEEGPWTTTIEIKGDTCIYSTSHDSGHFTKFVWKKGVGLIEHSSGYGAMKDGFRLKRAPTKRPEPSSQDRTVFVVETNSPYRPEIETTLAQKGGVPPRITEHG